MLNVIKSGPYALITCPPDWIGKSVEIILRDYLHIPKKMLHQWRMERSVLLNGEVISWSTKIESSSIMYIPIYAEDLNVLVPLKMKLDILYEDDVGNNKEHLHNTLPAPTKFPSYYGFQLVQLL